MNSKEALVELVTEAKSLNSNDERLTFLREQIEKDLEVLEILKKHIELTPYRTVSGFRDAGLNDNEYNKVKEWLENE